MEKAAFIEILSDSRALMQHTDNIEESISLEDFTRLWRRHVEDVPYISSMSGVETSVYYANISKHYYFYKFLIALNEKKGERRG